MEPFETRRLLLQPLTWNDLERLHALYRWPEPMQFITGRPRSLDESRNRLARSIADHKQYGLQRLRLRRVFATADRRNLVSIRVVEKVGMRQVDSNERGVEYEVLRSEKPSCWQG
jgi:RimJ/RimL family protein N-acetyltransferase